MSVKQKFLDGLVDDWKHAWKWFSVQASIFVGIIAQYAVTDPEGFAKIMESIPSEGKPLVGLLVAGIPIYLRVKNQNKPTDKGNDNG